jgi:hypothetical protein
MILMPFKLLFHVTINACVCLPLFTFKTLAIVKRDFEEQQYAEHW